MKKHNFYAGPSILSEYTIKNTAPEEPAQSLS